LKNGGAVFVCIDNIFVITSDEKVKTEWKTRIVEMSQKFHAVLKVQNKETGSVFDEATFTKKGNQSIIFNGIKFSRHGRNTKEPIDEVESLQNNNPWRGTFRELASIMGQCLWTHRVRGKKLIDLENFLSLYKHAFPDENSQWDDQVPAETINNVFFQQQLKKNYDECREEGTLAPYPKKRPVKTLVYLATDAALEEKKAANYLGAMWSYAEVHDELQPRFENSRDSAESLPESVPHISSRRHDQTHIALAELEAVIFAIEEMKKQRMLPDVFMIAIDSMAARGMISRGFSKVDEARVLLKKLDELIGDKIVFLHWVKSEENPADAPSRQKESWDAKQQKLWFDLKDKMRSLLPTALTFLNNGKATIALDVSNRSKSQQVKAGEQTNKFSGERRQRD
jgi:hypothetical protein